jgi:hypothetical protein
MGGPIEVTETSASKRAGTMSATAGGKAGIPLVAQGSAAVTAAGTIESSAQATEKLALNDLDTVVAEIGGSDRAQAI